VNEAAGKPRLRISYLTLGLAAAALVIVHATVALLEAQARERQTPRLAADSLVKALRAHHRQTGRFPADFRELEARVWKRKNPPDFGADGRGLSVANYYYIYHPVNGGACAIWIVPTGPRRDEGSTHFLLLTPDDLRRWKGAPLSPDDVKRLPATPSYAEMAVLGMTEQRRIHLNGSERVSRGR
jgi:hypothetical protein